MMPPEIQLFLRSLPHSQHHTSLIHHYYQRLAFPPASAASCPVLSTSPSPSLTSQLPSLLLVPVLLHTDFHTRCSQTLPRTLTPPPALTEMRFSQRTLPPPWTPQDKAVHSAKVQNSQVSDSSPQPPRLLRTTFQPLCPHPPKTHLFCVRCHLAISFKGTEGVSDGTAIPTYRSISVTWKGIWKPLWEHG